MRLWDEAEMARAEEEMRDILSAALWLVVCVSGVLIAGVALTLRWVR